MGSDSQPDYHLGSYSLRHYRAHQGERGSLQYTHTVRFERFCQDLKTGDMVHAESGYPFNQAQFEEFTQTGHVVLAGKTISEGAFFTQQLIELKHELFSDISSSSRYAVYVTDPVIRSRRLQQEMTDFEEKQHCHYKRKNIIKRLSKRSLAEDYSAFSTGSGARDLDHGTQEIKQARDRYQAAIENAFANRDEVRKAQEEYHDIIADMEVLEDVRLGEQYLEVLEQLPSIDESRLLLLKRAVDSHNRLASLAGLADHTEFAQVACNQINANSKNLVRDFKSMRDKNSILSVQHLGKLFFPLVQINRKTLAIYDQIPPLIQRAVGVGYTHWDILKWLLEPNLLDEPAMVVGKPLDADNLGDLLQQIKKIQRSEEDVRALPSETPLALIEQGDTTRFDRFVERWLGPEAESCPQ